MPPPPQPPPRRAPTPERKTIFFVGIAVAAIGFILFISVFFSAAANFGNFDNFEERGRSEGLRAVTGMVMMIVGGIVSSISGGAAVGAGITNGRSPADLLDDMLKHQSAQSPAPAAPVVMVRCQYCKALNDETAKTCTQCGGRLI